MKQARLAKPRSAIWVQLGCNKTSRGFLRAPRVAIGAVKLPLVTSGRWTVSRQRSRVRVSSSPPFFSPMFMRVFAGSAKQDSHFKKWFCHRFTTGPGKALARKTTCSATAPVFAPADPSCINPRFVATYRQFVRNLLTPAVGMRSVELRGFFHGASCHAGHQACFSKSNCLTANISIMPSSDPKREYALRLYSSSNLRTLVRSVVGSVIFQQAPR